MRGKAGQRIERNRTGQPHVIEPYGLYTAEQVQALLGISKRSLGGAKRNGLPVIRRFNKDLFLGEDVLDWLRAGRCSRGNSDLVEGAVNVERSTLNVQRSTRAKEG
jgi:hypothetical protein